MLNCEEEMGGVFVTLFLQGHSCALSNGGAVSCWGHNLIGEVILVVLFLRGAGCVKLGVGKRCFCG